jgi:hypothetical protein
MQSSAGVGRGRAGVRGACTVPDNKPPTDTAPAIAKKDVREFGMAYVEFLGTKKSSPKGMEDLENKKASFG